MKKTNAKDWAIMEKPISLNSSDQVQTTIVDAVMGSGKTTAFIDKIKKEPYNKFIFITPFLSEIDRIIDNADEFYAPQQLGEGKLESLHELLLNGKNVAATHQLFLRATNETIQLLHEGGYTLILDEALTTLHEYNSVSGNKPITVSDVRWLINESYLTVDDNYNATWNPSKKTDLDFYYSQVEQLSEEGTLKCIDNVLFWEYPSNVFQAFREIYVLTYLFQDSTLDIYLRMYGFKYKKMSIQSINGSFSLCDYSTYGEEKVEFSKLINLYDGKLNQIGNNYNAFSMNWLKSCDDEQIKQLCNTMRNYRDYVGGNSARTMWTTAKEISDKLEIKGFKYTKKLSKEEMSLPDDKLNLLRQFVPCNARATNDYRDRDILLYMINRYLNPEIKKYYTRQGFKIDEEKYAVSELVQWIWRSAIRDGKKINLFIPSRRMRELFIGWLNDEI